jgi:hypothetical protein
MNCILHNNRNKMSRLNALRLSISPITITSVFTQQVDYPQTPGADTADMTQPTFLEEIRLTPEEASIRKLISDHGYKLVTHNGWIQVECPLCYEKPCEIGRTFSCFSYEGNKNILPCSKYRCIEDFSLKNKDLVEKVFQFNHKILE